MGEFAKRTVGAIWFGLSASFLASGLATVSIAAVQEHPPNPPCADARTPSNFDYLVLAGIADSPQLHAMASYRSTASQRGESKSCDKDAVEHTTHKRIS